MLTIVPVLALILAGCGSKTGEAAQESDPNSESVTWSELDSKMDSEQTDDQSTSTDVVTNSDSDETGNQMQEEAKDNMEMIMMIDGTEVRVVWENNESVDALRKLAASGGLKIDMSMYGGFEQVGSIGQSIPRKDEQTTTKAGDIVLYSGNQVVVFYGSNSWAYTRLGRITGRTDEELAEMLGNGDVELRLEVK